MGEFFQKHSYLILWVSSLAIVGALAVLIFYLNGYIPSLPAPPGSQGQTPAAVPSAPAPPAVVATVVQAPTGNSLFVQWQNLPDGTIALNIYRGKTGTDESTWSLWKTVSLMGYDLSSGSLQISLDQATDPGYSFIFKAVGGTPDDTTNLWQSSSTMPAVATSTPPASSSTSPVPPTPPPAPPASSTPPSTPPNTSSSKNANMPPPTPSGTPYYNPQIQIETYGNDQSGNFWVQHVDQKIQIGWQNLPQNITDITIARSESESEPWTTVLTQHDPAKGSQSIQVVDDTVGVSYYYELIAFDGENTIAIYGPAYLTAQ